MWHIATIHIICRHCKGTKNKKKKKIKRRNDATASDEEFTEAFKDAVLAIDKIDEMIADSNKRQVINCDNDSEQTETSGADLLPVWHEEDEGYEQDNNDGHAREEETTNNEIDDGNDWFGSTDMYNVE